MAQKNCDTWADYEPPGTSDTASLCNGGWYRGDRFDPCPARSDCRRATIDAQNKTNYKTRVPVVTSTPSNPYSSRIIAGTPSRTSNPQSRRFHAMPSKQQQEAEAYVPHSNGVPPDEDNPYLQTPHGPRSHHGVTPTYIPHEEEGIVKRLAKNVAQGMFGSMGWHIFDMSNQVDFFPHKKKK